MNVQAKSIIGVYIYYFPASIAPKKIYLNIFWNLASISIFHFFCSIARKTRQNEGRTIWNNCVLCKMNTLVLVCSDALRLFVYLTMAQRRTGRFSTPHGNLLFQGFEKAALFAGYKFTSGVEHWPSHKLLTPGYRGHGFDTSFHKHRFQPTICLVIQWNASI